MKKHFFTADILLPDMRKQDGRTWSCVACDQYTSEPEYWESIEREIKDAPSTLKLILPEVYLSETDNRIGKIHSAMKDYLESVLVSHPDSMIYLERTLSDGRVRKGIIGAIDLTEYDYRRGSDSLIRATEATVAERIPPRMKVRRGAPLELPHVMLLIDDRNDSAMNIASSAKNSAPVYDHDLLKNSGHVTGYLLDPDTVARVEAALAELIRPETIEKNYGDANIAPLLFAVGDGNHSLATAKACYEEIRAELGDEAAKDHPARYALVEVVNLWDSSLEFEPIYRVVFGVEPQKLLAAFEKYATEQNGSAASQTVTWVYGEDSEGSVTIPHPTSNLAVGSVQDFLDSYMKTYAPESAYIDYIHGEDTARALAAKDNAVAFIYDGMAKDELFATVIADGALPRKTFSMGHAEDKRFYTEARKIL